MVTKCNQESFPLQCLSESCLETNFLKESLLILVITLWVVSFPESKSNGDNLTMSYLTLIGLSAISVSTFFKIMHWPYANILGVIALVLAVILLVYYAIGIFKENNQFGAAYFFPLLILLFVIGALSPHKKLSHTKDKAPYDKTVQSQ